MERQEAITAMKKGVKITHDAFSDNGWMSMRGNKIITEEGYSHSAIEFWSYRQGEMWDKGYSTFNN